MDSILSVVDEGEGGNPPLDGRQFKVVPNFPLVGIFAIDEIGYKLYLFTDTPATGHPTKR